MSHEYKKRGRGVRREYDGVSTEATFNFKVSPTDFHNEEETRSFLTYLHEQPNISNYIKSALISTYRREKEGVSGEDINKAIDFKSKMDEDEYKKILLFIELYGSEDIIKTIENKGKTDEEYVAESIGKKVLDYLKEQNLTSTISEQNEVEDVEDLKEQEEVTHTVLDFDD